MDGDYQMDGSCPNNRPSGIVRVCRIPSHVQEASSQCDGHRVGPIICLKFVDDILDVKAHSRFRDSEVAGDLLIPKTIADKSKNIQLTRR